MTPERPKFITFDCYGTLTNFRISEVTRAMFADRVPAGGIDAFLRDFATFRLDEVLGAWKSYRDVIATALLRTAKLWAVRCDAEDGDALYRAVPTWGPHADVPAPLALIATRIPLVILSNAANDQIGANVAQLGAPFYAVYTAEMAQAYKPRMRAFEFMFDQLGCTPADVMHVSSSYRYDLMTAHDMRVGSRVFVARGHEPAAAFYGATEIKDIGGLPALVGL